MKEKLRELIGALNRAYASHRKYMLQQCQKHGLYVGQPQVLSFVKANPGCTQNDIAANLGVTAPSIAFSTKRLQAAGFLQKQVNSLNMRCNKLYVTPEGIAILDQFSHSFDEMNRAMFDGFSEEELELIAGFIQRINSNMEKSLAAGQKPEATQHEVNEEKNH